MTRGPLRIALLHPTYWPEVRRGSERVVHDLGVALARRGHDVTILTTHRGSRQVGEEDGVVVDRARRLPELSPLRFYEHYLATVPAAVSRLRRGRFDLAHAFSPSDAFAASLARRGGGPRYVFSIHGIPTREFLVARRYRLEMLQRAITAAAQVTVLSEAAAARARRYLQESPLVMPAGVDVDEFAVDEPRAIEPTLICAATLTDPRKRGPLLLAAFERVRRELPAARLVLAGGAGMPVHGGGMASLPPGVVRLEADRTEVLARAYARAWASVLPSVEEAFGLVLIESMAAGTPVVAGRSGAVPELVSDDGLGWTFEPDDEAGLAAALALALATTPADARVARCRARAGEFDLAGLVADWERLYERIAWSA